MTHKIHQTPEEKQAHATDSTTEAVKSASKEIRKAVEDISVTKEIKIDFSETNELLKKLAEREDEPVNVSIKLNIK